MSYSAKTRPAMRTREAGDETQQRLLATIVYHPELARIGSSVALSSWPLDAPPPRRASLLLGRLQPDFGDGLPLEDPHVSRRALRIQFTRGGVLISADGPSADCRIGAEEARELLVDAAQIEAGVPVRLGHAVVLLLRKVTWQSDLPGTSIDSDSFPGASYEIQALRRSLANAANSRLPVLILGESGVGKELAAKALHHFSPRRAEALVAVNMAAIPEGLAAAELFGSAKGAFTGAHPRRGYFQQADGGTLFLDEIGDTPVPVQTQLLRALQTGEVQVVGGRPETVNVRIIAATDADTSEDSGFRSALKYRLAGITLRIPPLRARREDVGIIARERLAQSEAHAVFMNSHEDAEVAAYWARVFFDWLCASWPGNVRELINACDREVLQACTQINRSGWSVHEPATVVAGEVDDETLAKVHRASNFEVAATARALEMSRPTLYRRIDEHPELRLLNDISEQELRESIVRHGDDERVLSEYLGVSARALKSRLQRLRRVKV